MDWDEIPGALDARSERLRRKQGDAEAEGRRRAAMREALLQRVQEFIERYAKEAARRNIPIEVVGDLKTATRAKAGQVEFEVLDSNLTWEGKRPDFSPLGPVVAARIGGAMKASFGLATKGRLDTQLYFLDRVEGGHFTSTGRKYTRLVNQEQFDALLNEWQFADRVYAPPMPPATRAFLILILFIVGLVLAGLTCHALAR